MATAKKEEPLDMMQQVKVVFTGSIKQSLFMRAKSTGDSGARPLTVIKD
jgi:hypothetical protein